MAQAQAVGMEHKARSRLAFQRAIKRISQNRVHKRQHMHPKLMRTTRFWAQFHARFLGATFDHLPIDLCRAAGLMANHLPGPIRPIYNERKSNRDALLHHLHTNQRHRERLRLRFLKLNTQMPFRVW